MKHDVPVTVIVTAIATSDALRECLSIVRKQVLSAGGELLLVMNIDAATLPESDHNALLSLCDKLLFEPRAGKSNALNSAIRMARGEVVAFTDDDAVPCAGWLKALIDPLLSPDRHPSLVACGGPVTPVYPENAPAWYRPLIEAEHMHFLTPYVNYGEEAFEYDESTLTKVRGPIGANCAYRREIFDKYHYEPRLGPNRDTGLRGGEDTLINMLLLRDGYRFRYNPDARVFHPVHAERMELSCLKQSYYLNGLECMRANYIAYGEPGSGLTATALKLLHLQLKLFLLHLKPRSERWQVRRMRLLGKCARMKGRLHELISAARQQYHADVPAKE